MILPLVSCIMPTANREKYIPYAIKYFLQQDYPNKELIIIDDGARSVKNLVPQIENIFYTYTQPLGSIGAKRNYACERCRGEIILHWDDDDWHAPDWITASVYYLQTTGADIVGIQHINYYSAINDKFYVVTRTYGTISNPMNWVHGSTLAYRRIIWENYPFKDLQVAEDDDFIVHSNGKLFIHDYKDGFVCILHPHNTVIRSFEDKKFKIIK
jgi:glycosyltransferase involved in cell wall biosynthesis